MLPLRFFCAPLAACANLPSRETMGQNLFEKVWDAHAVRSLSNGQTQLLIGTHLIHEVTSPQAFGMLRDLGSKVKYPSRTFATVDHIVPTDQRVEPFSDPLADAMIRELRRNADEFGITYFDLATGKQGIVHVVGPEQGITQPGTTIACGDSHTATHGAFGAIAFGIGTTQVRDVLATQTMALGKLKVRRINVEGNLSAGVYAKDVILHIIAKLGAKGGIGYAYEYGGSLLESFSMEERMTICNMSIEGGARCGYVNPDEKTFEYLKGRPYSPEGVEWEKAVERWQSMASDEDCRYDDVVDIRAEDIAPTVTWGVSPDQAFSINGHLPDPEKATSEAERLSIDESLAYMKLAAGSAIKGTKVDVAFLGSCTNVRLSDFREVARFLKGHKVANGVKAIAVPGSQIVDTLARNEGLHEVFTEAGFEWRGAGCSMCLAMNPDKLVGDQLCASSSNRNFKGRQGSPTGRTVLMSPVMVAAAAVSGVISDAREVFELEGALT
jgi:3-isopropylmalate/(R)-2-methylmalate dehydratase large subunit